MGPPIDSYLRNKDQDCVFKTITRIEQQDGEYLELGAYYYASCLDLCSDSRVDWQHKEIVVTETIRDQIVSY